MGQENQDETESTKTLPDGTPGRGRPRESDDDGSSIASGSPKNLLVVAIVVALLFFAGVVFHLAASLADSHATRDNWIIILAVLGYVGTGIFYSGLLLGLGALATAGSKAVCARLDAVARLLTNAGIVLILLGIAESVCIIGTDVWLGWKGDASMVAFRMASRVFEAGVMAGMVLLCQRQSRRGRRDEKT